MSLLPKEYISAGDFAIEDTKEKLLVALLGTCVGVALYDKENSIGGIIHLLLPEPSGTSTSWQPENYASMGLPYFIKKLRKSGADKLEAVVAGGSLLGPVSKQDMALNIGGRTTEIVSEILKEEDIPVIMSETGGIFGSNLTLSTKTWEAAIKPISPSVNTTDTKKFKKISQLQLDEAINKTKPIPQIALKVINLIRDDDYNIKNLADEVSRDQVIGATVLKHSNSPVIGAKFKIDSIERALVLLGENHLLEIVISASVDAFYGEQEGGYSLMRGGMFLHALCVANIAKVISSFTGRAEPGTAYTAGLLHDIGKVVLDQYIARSLPQFYKDNSYGNIEIVSLEKKILGTDHQEAGLRLAEKWKLPKNLTDVIVFHHKPEQSSEHSELTHIVYLANIIASTFQAGLQIGSFDRELLPERIKKIGLSTEQLPVIIDRVPWGRINPI